MSDELEALRIDDPGWVVPLGYEAKPRDPSDHCRSCRAEVLWARTPAGKYSPLDRDGTSHFASCPDAASWRRHA